MQLLSSKLKADSRFVFSLTIRVIPLFLFISHTGVGTLLCIRKNDAVSVYRGLSTSASSIISCQHAKSSEACSRTRNPHQTPLPQLSTPQTTIHQRHQCTAEATAILRADRAIVETAAVGGGRGCGQVSARPHDDERDGGRRATTAGRILLWLLERHGQSHARPVRVSSRDRGIWRHA